MKFIYLADTHIGGSDNEGYRKQPRYLANFQEIIDCLAQFINQSGDIDFVIHGGDMIEETTPNIIATSAELFKQLPCPTYLVLGNHDLTTTNSVEQWMQYAPQLFPDGKPDFRLIKDGVQLDVLMCNWGNTPAFWNPEEPQIPWLSDTQLKRISKLNNNCFTQIVITHSPVYGLPPEQHDGSEPMHPPAGDFCEKMSPHLNHTSLVLGAHTHMNMALMKDNCYFATVAAFSETPFEFKLIEATPEKLSMQTLELGSQVTFKTEYDIDSAYVQGRDCDRNLQRKLP
jgi:3',5'-cyclic-AMP phosphodiesterase